MTTDHGDSIPVEMGIFIILIVVGIIVMMVDHSLNLRKTGTYIDPLANCTFQAKERTGKKVSRMEPTKLYHMEYETVNTYMCPDGKKLVVTWEK